MKIKSRGKVRRFLKSDKDAKKLGGLISEINDSIQDRIVVRTLRDPLILSKLTLFLEDTGNFGKSVSGYRADKCTHLSLERREVHTRHIQGHQIGALFGFPAHHKLIVGLQMRLLLDGALPVIAIIRSLT